jgi:hypothetical protein
MLHRLVPEVGQWYRNERGTLFEVVAFDDGEPVVEIQYFDGTLEELDMDAWYAQMLNAVAEPEDWSGPFDDLVNDDFGDTENVRNGSDEWGNPLDTLDWEE